MLLVATLCYGATPMPAKAAENAPVAERPVAAPQDQSLQTFLTTLAAYEEGGGYDVVIKFTRTWQKSRPADAQVWLVQGRAYFYDGDYSAAIASLEQAQTLDPALQKSAQEWLDKARALKKNWGDQPGLFTADNEITTGKRQWHERGQELLEAKNYDEIERVAAELTRSQKSFADGTWALSFFFEGITELPEGRDSLEQWEAQRAKVEAWLEARPDSDLARASLAKVWNNGAWKARGGDWSAPEGAGKFIMERNDKTREVIEGGGGWNKLMPKSPLFFEVFHNWAMLTGLDNALYQEQLAAANAAFPRYEDAYKRAAHRLLPRWYGGPGEWQKYAQLSADSVAKEFGTAAGDALYARMFWRLARFYPDGTLWKDSATDWARIKPGIESILQTTPDSLAAPTFFFDVATEKEDWEVARAMLEKLNGRVDGEYYKYRRKDFAPQRVKVLEASAPQ